ncbi:MAG: fibronectin type III domain-containing protein [Actinomycetota bacterium]|nr:fibronectin type III domain-containing protein [Actinomycetota bacterium]MDA3035164.1 fibronectin type III domain-containing protein [Actinomycetota bacterium]
MAVLAIASAALYPSAINAAPGDLDQTFGTNGMSSINPIYAGSAAILLQPDGKIILTGYFDKQQSPYDRDVQLARLNPDGTPDLTFGTGGVATIDLGGTNDEASASVLLADGKILVAGERTGQLFLLRLSADGQPDTSFASGGYITNNVAARTYALLRQSSGKIIIQDNTLGSSSNLFLARFNTDGTLDTSFGSSGQAVLDAGAFEEGTTAFLDNSDRILLTGRTTCCGDQLIVGRFTADGVLDTSFGTNGFVTITGTGEDGYGNAIATQSTGSIIIAGHTYGQDRDMVIARLHDNGNVDTTFGTSGLTVVDLGVGESIQSIAVQSDDSIFAIATREEQIGDDFMDYVFSREVLLVRFDSDGNLDTSFDGDGVLTLFNSEETSGRDIVPSSDSAVLAVAGDNLTARVWRVLTAATPSAPTELSVVTGDAQATLTWTAPTNNGGAAITGYTVQSTTDGTNWTTEIADTSTLARATRVNGAQSLLSATIIGLSNNVSYQFRVAAISAEGIGAFSFPSSPATPAGPTTTEPASSTTSVAAPETTVAATPTTTTIQVTTSTNAATSTSTSVTPLLPSTGGRNSGYGVLALLLSLGALATIASRRHGARQL